MRYIHFIYLLLVIGSIFLFVLFYTRDRDIEPEEMIDTIPVVSSGCIVNTTIDTVRGMSMEPMISSGDELSVLYGYYRCGGIISQGDIVIIEDTATRGPYVKVVRALPGDAISIATGGTLVIAGVTMENSKGEVYHFDAREQNFLSLYIQDGILQPGAYFVFGDNISTSTDSRKFGAIGRDAFVGKVIGKNGNELEK